MDNSVKQSFRLFSLGAKVLNRKKPLGIGLKNECWGGVAAKIAIEHNTKVTEYYGISFREFRNDIMKNNETNPNRRNFVMGLESFRLGFQKLLSA